MVTAPYDVLAPDSAAFINAPAWCPWLYASGPNLKRVVREVVTQALHAERVLPRFQRKRARRTADREVFEATIDSLITNTAYEYIRGAGPITLSLANDTLRRTSRYLSPLQCTQLPEILRLLGSPDLALLAVVTGTKAGPFSEGRLTRVAAGPRLLTRLAGVTLDEVSRKEGEEVVLLKSNRDDQTGATNLIDYADNELADSYRAEMRRINAHLLAADIDYSGSVLFDENKRHLVRRFTRGEWGCGGRLWGGFWDSPMTKRQRFSIRINGDRVVSVDFNSMIVRLAYAYVGVQPPAGDLYAFSFKGIDGTPLVLPRNVVKKILAARLNGAKDWPEELREYRKGLPWRAVVTSLKAAHPPIAAVFDMDMGQQMAFTESEILVDALLRLIDQDVTALPLHDCVLVAASDERAAVEALLTAFTFHTHQLALVTIDDGTPRGET